MKILCVIDSLGSGGAQRQIVAIAKGIKARGHDVYMLVYHDENFYLEELLKNNIKYTCISEKNYLKRLLKMRKFIRKGNFDGIISFLEAANFITTIAGFPSRNWKLIVGERNANPIILKSPKLRFYRWFHFFTDYVVANSQANIDMVKKINPFLSNKKYRVIYNIVDSNLWISTPKKTLGDRINIIVAATHEPRKNALGLINAVNLLEPNVKNRISVKWFGREGESLDETKKTIKKFKLESIVKLYPATTNILKEINKSDVVGLFSFYEGLPNIICEAMTLGKPVLTSAVSDLPIILKKTKNILFDPTETKEICKALNIVSEFNDEIISEIGNENLSLSKHYFNLDRNVNSYIKLLKS